MVVMVKMVEVNWIGFNFLIFNARIRHEIADFMSKMEICGVLSVQVGI
jgi:hypothetical protein